MKFYKVIEKTDIRDDHEFKCVYTVENSGGEREVIRVHNPFYDFSWHVPEPYDDYEIGYSENGEFFMSTETGEYFLKLHDEQVVDLLAHTIRQNVSLLPVFPRDNIDEISENDILVDIVNCNMFPQTDYFRRMVDVFFRDDDPKKGFKINIYMKEMVHRIFASWNDDFTSLEYDGEYRFPKDD